MGSKYRLPLEDTQQRPPAAICGNCEGELWGVNAEPDERGRVLCPGCRADESHYDAETVDAVMEAYDREVGKYLSEDVRNTIWNALSRRFPTKEAG